MRKKRDARNDDEVGSDESRRAARERAILELESSSASVVFDARVEAGDPATPARKELPRSA